MRVLGLTTGADTAGINYAIHAAFGRWGGPDWDVRSMVATPNYIGYPVDLEYDRDALERRYDKADVVHLHNTLHGHDWYDDGQRKPTILHHHGLHNGSERTFERIVEQGADIGAVQVCSTLDLAIREPSVEWLPAPVNIPAMQAIRREHYPADGVLRVGHAPTDRAVKGTAEFIEAMDGLKRRGLRVEMVLIEGVTWAECLRRKATCDLFYDQPFLGYGSNAVEAWAMAIPVIAGVTDRTIRAGMLRRWGKLPFLDVHEYGGIATAIERLLDPELLYDYVDYGFEHVATYHDERLIVDRLKSLYRNARPTRPGGYAKRLRRVRYRRPHRAMVPA